MGLLPFLYRENDRQSVPFFLGYTCFESRRISSPYASPRGTSNKAGRLIFWGGVRETLGYCATGRPRSACGAAHSPSTTAWEYIWCRMEKKKERSTSSTRNIQRIALPSPTPGGLPMDSTVTFKAMRYYELAHVLYVPTRTGFVFRRTKWLIHRETCCLGNALHALLQ